jgi:hypothetical protein
LLPSRRALKPERHGPGMLRTRFVYVKTACLDASFVKDLAIDCIDAVGNHLLMDVESHKILVDSVFFRIETG